MKALGLNPGEQEMIDMTNEVSVNGLIYYPEFCKLVLRKYREENRETLNQALFKAMETIKLNLAWSGKYKYLILGYLWNGSVSKEFPRQEIQD